MNYPLKHIDGMTTFVENKLKSIGIRTTEKLLEAASTVKGRKKLAEMTSIEEQQWLDWANNADVMRIKGLGSEIAKLLRSPEIKARLDAMAMEADGGSAESLGEYQKAEIVKWARVVKEAGIKID